MTGQLNARREIDYSTDVAIESASTMNDVDALLESGISADSVVSVHSGAAAMLTTETLGQDATFPNHDTSVDGINHQVVASTECAPEVLAENAARNGDSVDSAARDSAIVVVQVGGSLVGTWDHHRSREVVSLEAYQDWRLPNGSLVNAKNTVQSHSMVDDRGDVATTSNFYKRVQGVYRLIVSTTTDSSSFGVENGSKDTLPLGTLDSMDTAMSLATSRPMIAAVPIYRVDGVPLPWQEAQGETMDFPTSIAVGSSSFQDQSSPSSAIHIQSEDTIPTDTSLHSWAWKLYRASWTPLVVAFLVVLAMVVGGICSNGHCASPDSTSSQIVAYINSITLTGQRFTTGVPDNPTPEQLALFGLLTNENFRKVPDADLIKLQLRQQYALATLLSETQGFDKVEGACDIPGVRCDNYAVIGLFQANQSIPGPISADLALLSDLEHLDLSFNSLIGTLPGIVGQWSKLTHLDVSHNSLTGTVPTSVGQWSKLTHLDVSHNSLTGTVPTSVAQWTSLQVLQLSYNAFTGTLPETLLDTTDMTSFGAECTKLTGSLPDPIGPFHSMATDIVNYLNTVTLSDRAFEAPTADCQYGSLHFLSADLQEDWALQWMISKDQLELQPDNPAHQFQLRQRYALRTLWGRSDQNAAENVSWTHECDWKGIACQSIAFGASKDAVQAVTEIDLSNRGWSGHLLPDLGLLSYLQSFILADNEFDGSLPDSIGKWTRLQTFDLSGNKFSGSLPHTIGNLTDLEYFKVSGNHLKGSLPGDMGNWISVQEVDASKNAFTGTLPGIVGQWSKLTHLDVSNNSLTGTVPDVIGQWTSLERFLIEENEFSGSLSSSVGNWTNLTHFDVSTNQMTGSLPDAIGQWTSLQQFLIERNEFSGSLSSSVGNWTNLTMAFLGWNNFTGSLPQSIVHWNRSDLFVFLGNSFTGTIPSSICFGERAVWGVNCDKVTCECCGC
jgi:Leucine-rich repeat (LRR) protein